MKKIKKLNPFQEALKLYPAMISSDYARHKIEQVVRSERKRAMGGKIIVDGFYSYVCPDLYAFCEWLFSQGANTNPKGLIPPNTVYNAYYNDKDIEKVCCLRNPHLSGHEYAKRGVIKSQDCKDWFSGFDTVVSSHDLISKYLMCDWDGDEILVTSSKELYELADDVPPLYYDMFKAKAQKITNETIYDTLVKGFANNIIGDIANAIAKEWNSENPNVDLINVLTAYSNYSIDFPKTGRNIELGVYEDSYKKLLPPNSKPPYFFHWAKGKKLENCEEINNSVVNRISDYIKKNTYGLRYNIFNAVETFNPQMLMNQNIKVYRDSNKYKRLESLLLELKTQEQKICIVEYEDDSDKNEKQSEFDVFSYYSIKKILKIFINNNGKTQIGKAVNYLVDMEYYQPLYVNRNKAKNILWNCFGHILLNNLRVNLKSSSNIKARPRLAYIKAIDRNQDESIQKLDEAIEKALEAKFITITESDMNTLNKFDNKSQSDRLVLYVLICLYKAFANENGWLIISRKKKKTITPNFINRLIGKKVFDASIKRLEHNGFLKYINEPRKYIKIRLFMGDDTSTAFVVENIFNPLPYLYRYTGECTTGICQICSKLFVKVGNSKTCGSSACSKALERRTKDKHNHKAS